jgi:hypothetical protein
MTSALRLIFWLCVNRGIEMDNNDIKRLAYAMEAAYRSERTLGDATHKVADQFPEMDIPTGILKAMWLAIDAYIDANST